MTNRNFPWHYWAYGLIVKSEIKVPGFFSWPDALESSHLGSVTICCAPPQDISHLIPANVIQQSLAIQVEPETITLYLKGVAVFLIEQGSRIRCYPTPGGEKAKLSLALSGVVMAALLFQKGYFITHGSAVSCDGKAALFLGDSGAGKSSWAIALHQQGYPILTDDLAVVRYDQGTPHLLPAFPQMRVTQATADALGLEWQSLRELPDIQKRGFRFETQFLTQAIPLSHIYILKSTAQDPYLKPLRGHQKIMELMHHSEVMSVFAQEKSRHFLACSQLAQAVPIDYFDRPLCWERLPDVLDYFQAHWADPSHISCSL